MTPDPVLVLAWLILAHLVADFVLQTAGMVRDKAAGGRRGWRGLLAHGGGVGVCLLPFVAAFGSRGLGLLLVVTVGHVLIDRWKVRATRHAEAEALADARRRHEPAGHEVVLGPAWTPIPGALFIADQLAHAVLFTGAWLVLLAGTAPLPEFTALVDRVVAGFDPALVHRATLVAVVIVALLIVNVRAAALFVATLVSPRAAAAGEPLVDEEPEPAALSPRTWTLRFGPLVATAEREAGMAEAAHPGNPGPTPGRAMARDGHASPARIGATIGVLERLLIVTFVLTGSTAAIGFVVAAKTLARFRQLDDRDFAEYYLLGTLASVAVALGSGLLAAAALGRLG